MPTLIRSLWRQWTAVVCSILLVLGAPQTIASPNILTQQSSAPDAQPPKIPNDQLDSLVAPIALYPDELLAQVLAASTYPLEIMQLQQFLAKHKDLKDKGLTDAVMKQNWDPSVQAMAALPDVVKRLEVRPSLDHIRKRSEEHTSELQSRGHLVCRLLLEKKKNTNNTTVVPK